MKSIGSYGRTGRTPGRGNAVVQTNTGDAMALPSEAYYRDRAQETAVHEAGHAAALFLLGRGGDLVHVSTVPGVGSDGHYQRWNDGRERDWTLSDAERRREVNAAVLLHVAGLAAENRGTPAADRPPLAYVLDDERTVCPATPDGCGCDAHRAARSLLDDGECERGCDRRLWQVCGWAEELFDLPRVWGVVTALADRLPFGTVLPGDVANQIMAAAWGGVRVSIGQLGRQWSRRFQATSSSVASPP